MKRLVLLIITVVLSFGMFKGYRFAAYSKIASYENKDRFTFLICGLDDAAKNTDALILFNYYVPKNTVSFVHIPRDTYYDYHNKTNKINGIYPSLLSNGQGINEAMQTLTELLSASLGIKIDGYVAYTVESFKKLVDSLGGIDIEIPNDLSFSDPEGNNTMDLKRGVYHLSGDESVKFVRYRSGYALGDIGRINAQKLFLSAFVKKLKSSIKISMLPKALGIGKDVVTNINTSQILKLAVKMRGRIVDSSVGYANIPGKTGQSSSGAWMYYINSDATKRLLREMNFDAIGQFDRDTKFVSQELHDFYYEKDFDYKIYDDESLKDLLIK